MISGLRPEAVGISAMADSGLTTKPLYAPTDTREQPEVINNG